MDIIIIGCGKVGATLAETLCGERHNVVVIDTNADKVSQITEDLDAMGLVGNGASIDILTEAGVQTADILIAVTASDESNLLMCLMAKRVGKCHTIARVRNPMYSREIDFIKAQMGVSMVINPELATANEISRLLHYPAAYQIDTFAQGRVQLFKLPIQAGQFLDGLVVKDLPAACDCDVLLCAVERADDISIPDGSFQLRQGDVISVVASEENMLAFFRKLHLPTRPVSSAMIVGGGVIGYYLARRLLDSHIQARIIENDRARCDYLAGMLPGASVIHGDGTDRRLLQEEGLSQTGAFVSLTNMDEENILLSLYVKRNTRAKVVTKVNRLAFDDILEGLELGSVIYPKSLASNYILQYVRALQNAAGNSVQTLYRLLDDRVEALEFSVHETSPVVDVPLMDLDLNANLLICCIRRGDQIIIPRGHDSIQVGDSVIVVTLDHGLQDIRGILKKH